MKKSNFVIVLLIAASAILTPSCKKSPAAPPATPAATSPVFSATVNGSSESWGTSYYQLLSGGTYVNGFTGSQLKMQLIVSNAQVAGTYPIGTMIMAYYYDASNTMHAATSGTITISSISGGKISGTFSFNASSTVITSGVFTNVPIQ